MNQIDEPEGTTPLDPAESEGLLLTHITTRGELNRWEQNNILEAVKWLEREQPTDILNEGFARELHGMMFGRVWDWAGKFRKTDRNLGVPWPRIATDLHNLFEDAKAWTGSGQNDSGLHAVQLHHRMVSIHPFPNGNGRHSRLMADLFLTNILRCPRLSWGGGKLATKGEVRRRYIAALQAADQSDYEPLLAFARS